MIVHHLATLYRINIDRYTKKSCTLFPPFPWLWQRADGRRHHWPLKEFWQTAGWLSCSRLRDQTCQFCNFTTDSQFYRVEVYCSHDNSCSKQSIQFFVVFDAAVQTQHVTNHIVKVRVILMVQSSILVFWHCLEWFPTVGQPWHWWNCLWKGMKEPSVSPWTTGSWQVLTSASWISQFRQPNLTSPKFCLQFITIIIHTWGAILSL